MNMFERSFIKALEEDVTAGYGGAFGGGESSGTFSMGHGGAMTPAEDFYAKDDARTPKGGKKSFKPCDHCNNKSKCREAGKCLKVNKEKKHDGSIETLIPLQKRPFA